MNPEHKKLISAYLAGENVEEDLLKACKNNPALLDHLTESAIIDKLIKAKLNRKSETAFTQDIINQLKQQEREKNEVASTNFSLFTWLNNFLSNIAIKPAIASLASVFLLVISFQFLYTPNQQLAIVNKVAGNSENAIPLKPLQVLNAGLIDMAEGFAEISLTNGVVLVLEGPIRIKLKTADHVIVEKGNLVARVPEQAIGFKVDTPSSEIVDLGTEFAVSVQDNGESEVHVIEGEIKVRATQNHEFEHIFMDQARSFSLDEQVKIIDSNPKYFMRALPGISPDNPEYLHWTFDDFSQGSYTCQGSGIDNQCFNAQPKTLTGNGSGPAISNGQFGDALYFNGQDTWLETDFPGIGEDKPRTVAFWVKVPKDFSSNNGYGILSWGLSVRESAWQISPNPDINDGPLGRLRIGTNHAQVIGTTDIRDNRWHHVAIVLFGGEQVNLNTHILLYVDGKLEKSSNKSVSNVYTDLNHPESKPLMFGRNLGFTTDKKRTEQKFFKGWLDEVFIVNSALDQNQIQNLIKQNKIQ